MIRVSVFKKSLIAVSLFATGLAFTTHADDTLVKDKVVACGVITLYEKPPATKNMHFASINSIDGQVVVTNSKRFTLAPGKHVIKVIEHIRENSITRRRGEAKNFHIIEFEVEANKKYSLGAKYIRKNRSKFKTGEYWAPEVWKTRNSACKV